MYTVIVVEDEAHILRHMSKMLSSMDAFVMKGAFQTPEEALAAFPNLMPDIAFLDVEMPRMNGIELAKSLMLHKSDLKIVFTTAYERYAVSAFEVEAIDYIMKPVMPERLARVSERLDKMSSTSNLLIPPRVCDSFLMRCFGCFDVRNHKGIPIKWPTKKVEEVFAYLLVNQGNYISKWDLLELFWRDMTFERGMNNLYNTIYRIKQVLIKMHLEAQICKINDGYILEAEIKLSDLGQMMALFKQIQKDEDFSMMNAQKLLFAYATPLFGDRDYSWSLPMQKHLSQAYSRLCKRMIQYYFENSDFLKAEDVIRYYSQWHIEDEDMLRYWLDLLKLWDGYQSKIATYLIWFNDKLKDAELPLIEL